VTDTPLDAAADAPVLVAVVNHPDDLLRAMREGWYRIPLAHAPPRMGADFLAFYQTAAFPPDERWAVRWVAPVRGYRLTTRRELIPEQADHPRAGEPYYRVEIGALTALPHPIPSRRLRRITFIRTTVERLLDAQEINDLWLRSDASERLWEAIKLAGEADNVEREYPLLDDLPYTADFAALGEGGRVAVVLGNEAANLDDCIRERAGLDYPLAAGGWRAVFVDVSSPGWIERCLRTIRATRRDSAKS
jgi:hypothetical protein